jgi:hypothetical protein
MPGILLYGAGLLALVVVMTPRVLAGGVVPVPEIDGGSITTGLGLLTAGVLLLRARLHRR